MLVLAACGGGSSPQPLPPTGNVVFTNAATVPVDELYVASTADPSWGSPRNPTSISPSTTFTVAGLAPGGYDARAIFFGVNSTYYAFLFDFPVIANTNFNLTATNSSFTGSMKIQNTNVSGVPLSIINVVPYPDGSSGLWGANQLVTPLAPGALLHLTQIPSGTYDVRCVHADSFTQVFLGQPLPSLTTVLFQCP